MTSNIRKCLLCWEISYFLRNNNFFEELQLENTSSNVPNFLYMNSAWYIFRTHARDFESSLKFLRNLENKICTLAETRYFCFTNYLKNDKKCWKLWARIFYYYQVLFIYKNEIHLMMSPLLKTRQNFDLFSEKTWFLCKDKYFRQKVWLRLFSFFCYHIGYILNYSYIIFISITLISIFSLESVEEIRIC